MSRFDKIIARMAYDAMQRGDGAYAWLRSKSRYSLWPLERSAAKLLMYAMDSGEIDDGGPGSGNWGHKGRPGERGGSGKGGGKQYRGGRGDIFYTSSKGDWFNGLKGERQKEAQNWMAAAGSHYGVIGEGTGTEIEKRIMQDPSVEGEKLRRQLLQYKSEARSWDEKGSVMVENNLDENEQKIVDVLSKKYGDESGLPDESNIDSWDEQDRQCWEDLKNKAMGGETSGAEVPDDLQYEAGLKQRPKEGMQIPKTPQLPAQMPQQLLPLTPQQRAQQINDYFSKINDRQQQISQATTTSEIADIMTNSGIFYSGCGASIPRVDKEAAVSIYNSYDNVARKFPFLIGQLSGLNDSENEFNVAASCLMYGGIVKVNPDNQFFGNVKALMKNYDNMVKINEAPLGTDGNAVVTHELGHAIDGYLTLRGVAGSSISSRNSDCFSMKLRDSVYKALGKRYTKANCKAEVSNYATTNNQEWFAECFAEAMHSPNPRPVAAEMMRQLEEIIRNESGVVYS